MTDDEPSVKTRAQVVVETRAACESIAVVRLNRPAERNSLSIATLEELDRLVSTLATRTDISAIIFTGTGAAFASGANIRELRALTPSTASAFARRGQRLMQRIADAPQLTIAAVNGYCMGGGLDLALACDLRCASRTAVFAHPGARLGIITGWGGTQRLPRLIGQARALEMFATARQVTADEAHEIGLVNRVGDPVVEITYELALSLGGDGVR
ncbi:MAG TPA: enoyl-CoA hydratase/isomerase family protein [Pyrinomonadaceae bacterium]|jgi:enoyl-CoA hydratase/carnithine racemase|nr:enoyl-CoA hydratase/isomerase family protein [Pyrinomonadaceae bacterium]